MPLFELNNQPIMSRPPGEHLELDRMIAAAVINPEFSALLLSDPELALEQGFQGEKFLLTQGDQDFLLSTRASSLSDLANLASGLKP